MAADSIDEIFYMPDQDHEWNRTDTVNAVSYLARTRVIDRIVALDDFDVEWRRPCANTCGFRAWAKLPYAISATNSPCA